MGFSAIEIRDPSEVRHLHFMTILMSFYCPVTAYMYIADIRLFEGPTKHRVETPHGISTR